MLLLQLLLALAYAALAHLASLWQSDACALAALGVLIAMVLVEPLLARRAWAWVALPLAAAGAWALYRAGHAALPLLLVPVVFVLAIAWVFARTLRPGSQPLITRIMVGIEGGSVETVAPELLRYTRTLTLAWALALLGMAAANLLLAMLASPAGLLESVGLASPWPITWEQWSWCANLLNYGVIGGFFLVEFAVRKRRFPGRYASFAGFVRKLAGLGPVFWRDLLR
ncbi:ketosynthase [Luteimonas sp. SJ-16]|uniref:Ketosynthase n=1 Tax=Luteimonas deserti TaxID=2752306 RepID=A0A7Z0QMA8_9GAMM|nr:ketosynthase [Luteimonas deserti]